MTATSAGSSLREGRVGYPELLREPQVAAVAGAHLVSMLGSVSAEVALSVLLYNQTGSALYASLAIAAGFVPQAVSGSLLSAIAERFRPRQVLIGSNLISALLAALLAISAIPPPAKLVVATLLGAIVPLYNGVRSATLADSLDAVSFTTARSLLRLITQSSLVAGFLCGGGLAALIGPQAVMLANAASFVGAAFLLWWRVDEPDAGTAGHRWRTVVSDSLNCLRAALTSHRITTLSFWLPPAFAAIGSGLSVGYAAQAGGGPLAAGVLLAAFGAGTVAAEAVGTRFSPSSRRRAMPALMLLTQIPAIAFLAVPAIPVAACLRMLSGCGSAYLQGLDLEIHGGIAVHLRRRMMVVLSSGFMASQGLAMTLAGLATERWSSADVIGAGGIAGVAGCGVLLFLRWQTAKG